MGEASDTRSIILKNALKLFVCHGYDRVSVRSIADSSNCNVGAISYHFGGKENLYIECIHGFDIKEIEKILSKLESPKDAEDVEKKLKAFIYEIGHFSFINKLSLYLVLKEVYSQKPKVKDIKALLYWPTFHQVESFLLDAQVKNVIRPDLNVSFFVRMLLFFIQSEIIFSQNSEPNMEKTSEEFMNICNRSIYVQ